MTQGHTPGPWQVNGSHVYGPDPARDLICQALSSHGRLVADRDLIAAAPELLAASKLALETLAPWKDDDFVWATMSQLVAAIGKATGGQS